MVKIAALFTVAAAADPRKVISSRSVFPKAWNQVSRADGHHNVEFTVGVKQTNLHQLEERFWSVSDPSSPEWQNFMALDEIDSLIAPKSDDKEAVRSWLSELPGAVVTDRGDSFKVRAAVKGVEHLFDTELHLFSHDYGHLIARAVGDVSIPAQVSEAIDIVSGLTDFPMRGPKNLHRDTIAQSAAAAPVVIPESLKGMYSVPAGLAATGVSQSVAEFQDDQSYNKQDLQTFLNQTDLSATTVAEIVGPYSGTYPDMEATLDTQYMVGVSESPEMFYWTTPGWQYEWANNFYSTKTVPESVSISWGWAESGQCQSGIAETECTTLGVDAAGYVARTNTEFQKIGLRGVSLFAASGDSGANGRTDGECTGTTLHASFPGSSPYITAVGATQFSEPKYDLDVTPPACTALGSGFKCASGGTEVAVSQPVAGFTSGGGFSTYTPMPAYQQSAVEGYLSSGVALPPSTYFNKSNRAYPDVAAMGNNFAVYLNSYGGWTTVGGTSASSPTFASIAGYLNSLSMNKTGKPLGFMNPLLYKMAAAKPSAFTDIVSGDNKCTEDGCFSSCKGYECAKGWDPVTGLGTPVLSEMLAYIEAQLDAKAVMV